MLGNGPLMSGAGDAAGLQTFSLVVPYALCNGRKVLLFCSQRETRSISEIKIASTSMLELKNNVIFLVWMHHVTHGNLYHGPLDSIEVSVTF